MKDRVPASGKGGRVSLAIDSITASGETLTITNADGTLCGILGHADDATQVGSVYNKASVLPTSVTSALGLTDASAEPKDAFVALNNKINSANTNISKLTSITSGNYTQVGTSDVSGGGDNTPDWRSVSTSKNDFLISVSANVAASSRILNISIGSVVFSRTLSNGTSIIKPHIWRTGNVWMCQWDDGKIEWAWRVTGDTSIVIKAALNTQSVSQGNVINSLTVYGR